MHCIKSKSSFVLQIHLIIYILANIYSTRECIFNNAIHTDMQNPFLKEVVICCWYSYGSAHNQLFLRAFIFSFLIYHPYISRLHFITLHFTHLFTSHINSNNKSILPRNALKTNNIYTILGIYIGNYQSIKIKLRDYFFCH